MSGKRTVVCPGSEQRSELERSDPPIHEETWRNPTCTRLSETSPPKNLQLSDILEKAKLETVKRVVVSRGQKVRREEEAEHRALLRQGNYSAWYRHGGYMSSYVY